MLLRVLLLLDYSYKWFSSVYQHGKFDYAVTLLEFLLMMLVFVKKYLLMVVEFCQVC